MDMVYPWSNENRRLWRVSEGWLCRGGYGNEVSWESVFPNEIWERVVSEA